LARLLYDTDVNFDLISLEGGSKHNAIPREAFALIMVKQGDVDELKKRLQDGFKDIQFEYKAVEKDCQCAIEAVSEKTQNPMEEASKQAFLSLLVALPHGVMAMSQEIPGLTETSNNLAIVKTKDKEATALTSTRSSILSALEATRKKIEAIGVMSGGSIEHFEGYPAWSPNLESPLLAKMKKVYKDMTGKEAEVMAIHAGLECGIIGDKYPGMDMISFGPELKNPHSPDEKVNIGSVERFWDFVVTTLKALL
jgi:dipeptidase D